MLKLASILVLFKCTARSCQYLNAWRGIASSQYLNSCSLRFVNARVSLPRTLLLFMLVHEFDALNKITTIVVFKAIVFFSVSLSSYFVCVCVCVCVYTYTVPVFLSILVG